MPKLTFDQLDSQVLRPETTLVQATMAAWRKLFTTGVKLVAGTALVGKVGIDQTTPGTTNGVQVNAGSASIGGTKDNGPFWTVARLYTPITTATTTDITAAPTSGQKIVLDDCLISCDAACAVSIIEETSLTVFAKVFVPANGTVQITLRDALKAAVADKKMRAITGAAVNCSITACYHSEA